MADAIITLKIMPESPDIDLAELEKKSVEVIKEITGETQYKSELEPIAFGLKAIKIIFVMDEQLGSPDKISEKIADFEEVASCEVTDVRRAIG